MAPALCFSVCVVNIGCHVSVKHWLLHGGGGGGGGGEGVYRYEEGEEEGYVVLE